MVQCEDCGHWRADEDIDVMDFGPHKGSFVCDDCWNDAPIPVQIVN